MNYSNVKSQISLILDPLNVNASFIIMESNFKKNLMPRIMKEYFWATHNIVKLIGYLTKIKCVEESVNVIFDKTSFMINKIFQDEDELLRISESISMKQVEEKDFNSSNIVKLENNEVTTLTREIPDETPRNLTLLEKHKMKNLKILNA